jgi:polysaccharide pyruvyl transferase WcaK-like protein
MSSLLKLALRSWLFLLLITCSSLFAGQKVVLFNDTSAWYHWGCTGTSTALKEGIQKAGFEIQALPINVTYTLKEVPPFEEFANLQRFDRFCEENRDVIASIQNASAVVINGEGTIHDLRAGPQSLLYLAYISKKFMGKMEEWLDTINHATFLVSGRFHHSITAFCLNTPFIALNSNTYKVHAICSLLEQAEPLHFSDPYLLDHLLLRTTAILSSPLVNNEEKMAEICQLAERNFDGLRTCCP